MKKIAVSVFALLTIILVLCGCPNNAGGGSGGVPGGGGDSPGGGDTPEEDVYIPQHTADTIYDESNYNTITVFEIYTPDQLVQVAALSNTPFNTNKYRNFTGKTVRLMNDIDLLNVAFTGISVGSRFSKVFSGTFNGTGKAIKNMEINTPDMSWVGLIGACKNGSIYGVTIESGSVTGVAYVGGVVGFFESSGAAYTFENCRNKASVTGTKKDGGENGKVGGIAGYLALYYLDFAKMVNIPKTVKNCFNEGTVRGTQDVGGIIGYMSLTRLIDSQNTGTVSFYNPIGTSGQSFGGIVGNSAGNIENCSNSGIVSINTGGNNTRYAGGITGELSGAMVQNCTNTGVINADKFAGGITGIFQHIGSITETTPGIIKCCKNTGAIRADSYAGGIAGDQSGHVLMESSYSTGAVTALTAYAGGLVGIMTNLNPLVETGDQNGKPFNNLIKNCYTTGTVTAGNYTSGIAGEIMVSRIENCYSVGTITLSGSQDSPIISGISATKGYNYNPIASASYYLSVPGGINTSIPVTGGSYGTFSSCEGRNVNEFNVTFFTNWDRSVWKQSATAPVVNGVRNRPVLISNEER